MPFAVDRIDHVEVFVRDLDAAATWYANVLGLEECDRWDPEPLMIGRGGTKLALFRAEPGVRRTPTSSASPGWHRVSWQTSREGFAAAQEHLRTRGVLFRGPIDHGNAWSIYFDDPDGHPLEITCEIDQPNA